VTRVKVCGLKTLADLRAAEGADAVGFVVASPDSKRNLAPFLAADLAARAAPFVQTVLVTREAEPARLAALQGAVPTGALQVHGVRDATLARAVRKATSGKLVLSVGVEGPDALRVAAEIAPHADAILLDSVRRGKVGGTGHTHDWNLSARIVRGLDVPVILAGGLTPANVAEAIRVVKPYAVDVSGGVEGPRGKSRSKVLKFLEAAHG
jgi:phosphoribosylanthranilate isomerase